MVIPTGPMTQLQGLSLKMFNMVPSHWSSTPGTSCRHMSRSSHVSPAYPKDNIVHGTKCFAEIPYIMSKILKSISNKHVKRCEFLKHKLSLVDLWCLLGISFFFQSTYHKWLGLYWETVLRSLIYVLESILVSSTEIVLSSFFNSFSCILGSL